MFHVLVCSPISLSQSLLYTLVFVSVSCASVGLSTCLSLFVSIVRPYICLNMSVYLSVCLSVRMYISALISVCHSLFFCVWLSVHPYLGLCFSVSLSSYLYIYMSICLFMSIITYLSAWLFIRRTVPFPLPPYDYLYPYLSPCLYCYLFLSSCFCPYRYTLLSISCTYGITSDALFHCFISHTYHIVAFCSSNFASIFCERKLTHKQLNARLAHTIMTSKKRIFVAKYTKKKILKNASTSFISVQSGMDKFCVGHVNA